MKAKKQTAKEKMTIKEELRLILKDYHYNNDEQHMSKDVVTALENLLGSIVNSITYSPQSAYKKAVNTLKRKVR